MSTWSTHADERAPQPLTTAQKGIAIYELVSDIENTMHAVKTQDERDQVCANIARMLGTYGIDDLDMIVRDIKQAHARNNNMPTYVPRCERAD